MKKIFLSAALVLAAVAGTVCYNSESRNENEMSDLAKANVKALAEEERRPTDDDNDGKNPHGGGLANKHCPIWNVSYEYSLGVMIKVGCSTGGDYKCEAGTCPHGA